MNDRDDAFSSEFWTLLTTATSGPRGQRVEAQRQWEWLCLPVLEELTFEELRRTPRPTGPLYELPLNVVQTALPQALKEARRQLRRYRLSDLRAGRGADRLLRAAVRWAVGEWTRFDDGDACPRPGAPRGEPTWAALPFALPAAVEQRPAAGRQSAHRRAVLLPAAESPDVLHVLLPDPGGPAVLGGARMLLHWRRVAGVGPEEPGEAAFWALAAYLPSRRADPALGNDEGALHPFSGRGALLECHAAGREKPEALLTRLDLDPSRSLVSMPRICRVVTPATLQAVGLTLLDQGPCTQR